MKKVEIKASAAILRRINITKVGDKDIRKALFNAFLTLVKADKEFDEDMKLAQEKAFEGMDLNAHNELVGKIQKATTREEAAELEKQVDPKIVEAIKDFNNLYEEHLKATTDIELERIDLNDFLNAMVEQDFSLSLAELEVLTNTLIK